MTPEQREKFDEIAAGLLPEDKWYLEQRVRLFRKYRWTERMLRNPVRVFWYELLFPFFHWRVEQERHCRKVGHWAMGVMAPCFNPIERGASQMKEAGDYVRGINRRIGLTRRGL